MDGVTATFSLTCDASALSVSYSIENRSGADVGLFNRIARIELDGSTSYDPANVYVDFSDEILFLRKAPLVVPSGLSAGGVRLPAVTLVPSGQRFAERFTLPVPVPVCEPMRRALLSNKAGGAQVVADRLVHARRVEVVLGAFRGGPDLQYRELFPAAPGVLAVWPPGVAAARQEQLTFPERLRSPLPVLDYRVATAE
ncbi:hypothetical protein SCE1572_34980 [Sorangium cellulosum So0157-2]|uniref:Uncharacterized protein n=1 Tax=Sorangium cellulosum So0157-2 TaxID=1254432 RepID=S4Y443_SORCE|nr:hypothetical protein SCE1572_34980 [Sorangium cellulosum So0157-2]